ncbi:MAG: preprotein translocase subunit SecY [Planctomycetes bacterium]|nr:preprotein translocase subunit SecY [Planctomycetota bacterium]
MGPTRIRRILENIFSIPELIAKIGFTVALLAIYRIGFYIPIPGLDQIAWGGAMEAQEGKPLGQILQTVALFTGGNLKQSTLFGLGIMPYITAAIIFQLLGTVVPAIERLQREGEAGRRKIQEYTRYAAVVLCVVQASFWMSRAIMYPQFGGPGTFLMGVLGMTAGTIFLMWLGEQIDEYGIGNGISLLIMASIVARIPSAIAMLMGQATLSFGGGDAGGIGPLKIVTLAGMFVFVVAGAILITQGQRRIPVQQAKMTRGRRVYGGQRQYLPLRVNHGGVMPIIFASALMMFPSILFSTIATRWRNPVTVFLASEFASGSYLWQLCYIGMIFFFAFFWTTVQFKPKEMAEQLRDYGSFIPGLRPGKRTADYLERVMERITYCGAAFLAVIAVLPSVVTTWMKIPFNISAFLGGTGLLITVSVTLDLVQRIEAQLVMRNYGGFLGEGSRIKGVRG